MEEGEEKIRKREKRKIKPIWWVIKIFKNLKHGWITKKSGWVGKKANPKRIIVILLYTKFNNTPN